MLALGLLIYLKHAYIDNFWSCQDVMFDWTADLAGIGGER